MSRIFGFILTLVFLVPQLLFGQLTLSVNSITANELSENWTRFATKSDEVILVSAVVHIENDTVIGVNSRVSGPYEFSSSKKILEDKVSTISCPSSFNDDKLIVLLLFEQDTDLNILLYGTLLSNIIGKHWQTVKNRVPIKAKTLFPDDDLLGMLWWPLKKKQLGKEQTHTIEGYHLFDDYSYTIRFEVMETQ